jgi:hypothetical protein
MAKVGLGVAATLVGLVGRIVVVVVLGGAVVVVELV